MNSNVKLFKSGESSTKFWLAILAICLQLEKPLSLQGVALQHTSGIVPLPCFLSYVPTKSWLHLMNNNFTCLEPSLSG